MSGTPGSARGRVLRVAVVVVLIVVCVMIGSALLGRMRSAESAADRSAASYTPPAVATANPPLVSVITDEVSGAQPGSEAADSAPDPWISRVSSDLSIRLAPFLVAGSGYTRTGPATVDGGSTYVVRADQVSSATKVAVFIGGSDRGSSPAALIKAATRAYSEIRSVAPDAKVVVVGPLWRTGSPPADVESVRTTLRSAARVAGATWVDPIGGGWLRAQDRWTSAGVPSAAGQRELGMRMTAVLTRALE